MDPTSNELINAAVVPSSVTAVTPTVITNAQVKDVLLGYLAQKDYTLPKHFEQGYAMASPVRSFEETITGLQVGLRRHLINQAIKNEETYHHQAQIINKVFENIQNLMELLTIHGVKCESTELAVSLIGNLLKSLA